MGKKDWLRRSDDDVSCAGRSLVEIMEEELDDVMTQLMENVYDEDEAEDAANLNLLRGKAQGISTCLAIIQNPYAPSIDGIKADAVRRYEARKRMTSEAH